MRPNPVFLALFVVLFSLSLFCQEVPPDSFLTKEEWDACENFILKKAPRFFAKGHLLIAPHNELPFPVEKDPTTGAIYIHLKSHPKGKIGHGSHKSISKSILYGKQAYVIARCEADQTGKRETEQLAHLKNIPGVLKWFSTIERPNNRYDLFVQYCNRGDISPAAFGKLSLSDRNLFSVLYDLAKGLRGMHQRGYIHRDIKKANIFLLELKGLYHGIIGDVCYALPIKEHPEYRFCIPDENAPPEIYCHPFEQIDRQKGETYSLGVIFYMLIWNRRPPWTFLIHHKFLNSLSSKDLTEQHSHIQKIYSERREQAINRLSGPRKKAARIIYEMVNPDPKNRPTLERVEQQMKTLFETT